MKKTVSKCGYTVYIASAHETFLLGGYGICDHCNEFTPNGYLIPVLNSYICSDCYKSWDERAIYYPEDIPAQDRTSQYYENKIPLSKEN